MSKHILLTGGAGYIGSHVYVALVDAGYTPVILDNFSNADDETPQSLELITKAPVICHRCDILDAAAVQGVFAQYDFTAVIHFAAKKAVGESVRDPLLYFEVNGTGFLNLLRAMERAGVKTLVFSSSATVYGTPEILPITEDAATGFTNPYAPPPPAGEQMLDQIAAADPDWTIGTLRYFNPVGAHPSGLLTESPRKAKHPPENLMPRLLDVAIGKQPFITVFGDDYDTPDGTGVRDYIHVSDLARGHVLSLNRLLETDESHLLNLGTGQGYSVLELIQNFSAACAVDLPYKIMPRRPGDIAACYADPSRARDLIGFEAEHGVDEMCRSSWNSANSKRQTTNSWRTPKASKHTYIQWYGN